MATDDGRRSLTGPEPAAGPHEIVALKQPFVVCGKIRRVDEARRVAGSAQMQLDNFVPLMRRFCRLIKS
jgi:hypothetical protein